MLNIAFLPCDFCSYISCADGPCSSSSSSLVAKDLQTYEPDSTYSGEYKMYTS